ncbi:COP9 signalosome complex subunit 3 [Silene latifolia]|uniref:COP9 signalosome complex subunit 3 n=1 Tax=Silene latifolia TaxID=37657 RepID=UPI003D77042D
MDAVERVVAQIQGLSGTTSDLHQLHVFLKHSDDSLRGNSSRLPPFFSQLDPSFHSLGYLYLLDAYLFSRVPKDDVSEVSKLVARFINVCRPEQIRLASEKFIHVCKKLKDLVMGLDAPIRGVAPMLTAIRKVRASSEHLTTLHPDFLLLCISAKCYKTGLSLLEEDVLEVDHPKDLFLYCYYGGMIYIGLKKYGKALELLHNVVTSPMSTLSSIAVEAYKKYILVSLIHNGQHNTHFPKYTSSVAQRSLKNFTQAYLELATSYSNGDIAELQNHVEVNKLKFESDNNLGLVKQVVSSIYKRNIQRLTQTYITLSLEDIANTVQLNSPTEAEMNVLQMIEDGQIYATINQKDGMVRFHEDPEQYKTCEMIETIDKSIQRIMGLSRKLTAVDEKISCDPLYLAKVGKERQRFDFDDFDGVPQRFNI